MVFFLELVMGVGPMNLVITNDALYQLSYTSAATRIIAKTMEECKLFFLENEVLPKIRESRPQPALLIDLNIL